MVQDPVCGMEVSPNDAIKATKDGLEYYFCNPRCLEKFIKESGPVDSCPSCQSGKRPIYKNKLFIIIVSILLILLASFALPILEPFRNIFITYFNKIWWAVLIGLALGGVIDHFIPREYFSKVLSKRSPSTIFNAVILGFLMSSCSHGILALSIQIHKKGASNPAVISFLLASPWANIAITVMLFAFFGIKGLLIILSAILIAIITGFVYMWLEKMNLIEKNKNTVFVDEDFSIRKDLAHRLKNRKINISTIKYDLNGIFKGAVSLGDMVLWWILLGAFIASMAGAYIPVHFFHQFMGPSIIGLLVCLGLATVIEVCSEGSSPLAFEIYRQTGALGNSFVFLMGGVVTDYTEIGLLWTNVGRRVAIWLPIITIPQVIIMGYLLNRCFNF